MNIFRTVLVSLVSVLVAFAILVTLAPAPTAAAATDDSSGVASPVGQYGADGELVNAPDAADVTAEAAAVVTAGSVRLPLGSNFQAAVNANPPGTRFVIARGIHRMQQVIPRDGDSFVGEPGAIVSGARRLLPAGFRRDGARWFVTGQTQEGFTTGATLPGFERDQHPEELFVNGGRRLRHAASLADLGPGAWFFDYAADRIYLGEDPATFTLIETSVTPFAFGGTGVRNVTIENLIVEKYASPYQRGAIGGDVNNRFTYDWTVRNTTVRRNHAGGIQIGPGMTVDGCQVVDNGQIGISGEGSHDERGYSARVTVRRTEIARNLVLGFDWGHEGGGTKFSNTPSGMLFEQNWVHHNAGPGAWWDVEARHVEIRSNLIELNEEQGIFYEISWNARIYWNVVRRNSLESTGAPIDISQSHDVEVFANLLVDNRTGIYLRHDHRRIDQGHLANVRVHDNDIHSSGGWTGILLDNAPDNSVQQAGNTFYRNTYRTDNATWLFNRNWGSYDTWRQAFPEDGQRLPATTRGTLPTGATPFQGAAYGAR
jgi:Right handed beta helix region